MDTKLKRDFIKTCTDGWLQGWHERNGGNLSYRMIKEEVEDPGIDYAAEYKKQTGKDLATGEYVTQ